jgi:predicted Zn-dependent protease
MQPTPTLARAHTRAQTTSRNAGAQATRILCSLVVLMMGAALVGCATNPTTGRSQLRFLSWDEEIALGEGAKSELTAGYGGSIENRIVSSYVEEVGATLVEAAVSIDPELSNLPWEFTLLDSDVINAFALPGGKVFASRGLLDKFDNEAQMALVIGHEIGHVAARHGNERISQANTASFAAQLAGAVVGDSAGIVQYLPMVIDQGSGLYLLSYGRSQELEADELGMRYMVMSGYDPQGAVQALGVLASEAAGSGSPEFLSTHPDPQRRLTEAMNKATTTYADTSGRLGEREFRSRYINQMAMMPPPSDQRRFALGDTSLWCSTCAQHASADH